MFLFMAPNEKNVGLNGVMWATVVVSKILFAHSAA